MPTPSMITPGFYAGAGQAKLLNMNQQCYLFQNTRVVNGSKSVAIQLSRMPRMAYPFQAAIQAMFGGAPGTFELDIEGAEDDADTNYVNVVTIVAVNSGNVGRAALGFSYPKFIRVNVVALANDVPLSILVTR